MKIKVVRRGVVYVQTHTAIGELGGKNLDHGGDESGSDLDVLALAGGIFAGACAHLHESV